MEITQKAIVVKLEKEEKDTLENAFKVIAEIHQSKLIQDSCEYGCPFKRYCNHANGDQPFDCLLDTTLCNLKQIMNIV